MKKVIPIVGACCLAIVLFITLQNKDKTSDSDLSVTIISHQEPSYEINSNIVAELENDPEAEEAMEYIRQQYEQSENTQTDSTNKFTTHPPEGAVNQAFKATPLNREWVISHKGKVIPVRACFVKSDFAKVYLKSEASGKVKSFQRSVFSDADIEYLKSIGK